MTDWVALREVYGLPHGAGIPYLMARSESDEGESTK